MREMLLDAGVNPKHLNIKEGKFDYEKSMEWLLQIKVGPYTNLLHIWNVKPAPPWAFYDTLGDTANDFREYRMRSQYREELRKAFNKKRPGCFGESKKANS
jgi:hypothetical protein